VIYLLLKEVGEALLSERKGGAFQRVVLVPYPGPGIYSIGLVTSTPPRSMSEVTGETLEGVFIPTPPNPWTGPLVYYKRSDLIPTQLRVDQAIKMVVSGGVVVPADTIVTSSGGA
jgi:uncharacterized membrane protein